MWLRGNIAEKLDASHLGVGGLNIDFWEWQR